MAYLNLDPDYFTHPKTLRLVALCGSQADVYPLRLWAYCGKYHPIDGTLKDYTLEEIESILKWPGDVGQLVKAMLKVGFLYQNGEKNIFQIHDWKEHEGHIAAFKARSKKANKARWNKDKLSKKQASLKHPLRNAKDDSKESPYLTYPFLTLPNQTIPMTAQQFIVAYCESFKELYGQNPEITKKDAGIVQRLIIIPDIQVLMARFFESKDKFITDNCHSLNIVESQLNKLKVSGKKQTGIDAWVEQKKKETENATK